ncbi:MAG: metal-binding protein [Acidobacteriota bacterium]|nr:metal-binding protein [Acidobacteriota bacterium]
MKTYTLLGADRKFYESPTKGALGGHRKDQIYGTLDCPGAKRWLAKGFYAKNRVFFADEETAVAAEFRPCANCLPEKYKEWKSINREQTQKSAK